MSTTHIRAALNASATLAPVERLVLILLGDFAGPDAVARPSVTALSQAANVSTSTITRALQRLVQCWLVERPRSFSAAGVPEPSSYRVIGGRV